MQFLPINNITAQNSYFTPVGLLGASYSANEPSFVPNGAVIEYNKYLVVNGPALNPTDNGFHMYEIWIYYIQGNMSTFVNIDTQYSSTYISSITMTTKKTGNNYYVDHKADSGSNTITSAQPLTTGWNLVMAMNY